MKKVEANRLLDLDSTALRAFFPDITHPDIAAPPEIVQVLLLGCEQLLEPMSHNAVHSPLGAAAEFFGRSRLRRVINHVFGEIDRKAGPGIDCEGDLAKILGIGNLVGVRARGF